jgi:ribonuclease-3
VAERDLEDALGYRFADRALLERALTHRSWDAGPDAADNERLEFLGDAVLYLVISEELYSRGDLDEGGMTKVRAGVVDEGALARVARLVGIDGAVRLGPGEEAAGGRVRTSILADAMEAVLAAVLLDGGIDAAREVITRHWSGTIAERAEAPGHRDFKTRLQELLAARGLMPVYASYGEGPDHDRRFTAAVTSAPDEPGVTRSITVDAPEDLPVDALGTGTGTSKKRAEQAAAAEALARLGPAGA